MNNYNEEDEKCYIDLLNSMTCIIKDFLITNDSKIVYSALIMNVAALGNKLSFDELSQMKGMIAAIEFQRTFENT